MSLATGSETDFGETPLLSRDASEASHDSRGGGLGPAAAETEFRMHSRETADASGPTGQSPSQLFRIRVATYGASVVIALGIFSVPALAICCFVPFLVIFALPALSILLLVLALLVPQLAYLLLAQTDAPPHVATPFLAFSVRRCLKIDRAALAWLREGTNVCVRVFGDWAKRKYTGQPGGARVNVHYGSPRPHKRLDIYTPHPLAPRGPGASAPAGPPALHPVIVFIPPQTRPFPSSKWLFSSLGSNLSTALSAVVVIPDLAHYPEGRIHAQIHDARLVLRYVHEQAARYGGDAARIYLAGHGLGGLLALLLPIQQAVAESRDDYLRADGDGGGGGSGTRRLPNGVASLKMHAGEVAVPPIKGLILLAAITDVDAHILHEGERGVHHLSIVRRVCGPGQLTSYLNSPAHLLYASRGILDVRKLPGKVLFLHGGLDETVSHNQSETMKEFLRGIGVRDAKVRLYAVGHWGIVTSLMFGMDGPISRTLTAQLQEFLYGATEEAGLGEGIDLGASVD